MKNRKPLFPLIIATLLLCGCSGFKAASNSGGSSGSGQGGVTPSPGCHSALTLNWTKPMYNTDGTLATDLAGYKIHYGASPANLNSSIDIKGPDILTHTLGNLCAGTWYFALGSVNTSGNEGPLTNEVYGTVNGLTVANVDLLTGKVSYQSK